MRQFFLVIILVAAAFGGGAFVNGPGLQWAQTRLLRSLGLNNGGEITSVDLKPPSPPEAGSDQQGQVKPERPNVSGPIAPTPSLASDHESAQSSRSEQTLSSQSRAKSSTGAPTSPRSGPSSSPPLEQPLVEARSPAKPPAADHAVKPAGGPSSTGNTSPDSSLAPAILDTLAGLLPSESPPSSPSVASAPVPVRSIGLGQKTGGDGDEDWMILERKMQSLGISRYTAEGEPGGRVVFSCLIPTAGRQAVSQRFEAEGDDLNQAAQAALRRITLWRATQSSTP